MFVLVILTVLVVAGLPHLIPVLCGKGGDAPARIVAFAASRLPAHRRDWGQAMAAELTQIYGRARRWRFTTGVLRVVLFPPLRRRNQVLAVAVAGLAVAAAATVAAASEVPTLSMFIAVLGLLLCGYATVVTSRSPRPRTTAPRVIVGALALAGVAVTIADVVRIAAAHPAATTDGTHVFSVLFALTLTVCLAFTLTPPRGGHPNTVLWWALAGALAMGIFWTVAVLTTPASTGRAAGNPLLTGAAVALIASVGASAATRSRSAGAQAGLLTAILGGPMYFAIEMTAILHLHHYTLTSPYDIAAYARSGYPDVASYLLSDALGGFILSVLLIYPAIMLVFALLGSTAGTALARLATTASANTSALRRRARW